MDVCLDVLSSPMPLDRKRCDHKRLWKLSEQCEYQAYGQIDKPANICKYTVQYLQCHVYGIVQYAEALLKANPAS